eukprot:41907_1
MAQQKLENIMKVFEGIQFANVDGQYNVKLEFNERLHTISLQFMNTTNTTKFSGTFTKQHVEKITARCQLSMANLSQVIVDQLSSSDFINKFCRIFICTDDTQATSKYEEISKLETVPDASGIIEGNEGKLDEENQTNQKHCLLFVVHFAPSKYVHCNFCFVIPEQYLSDTDRFMIKFNEIKAQNQVQTEKIDSLNQSLNRANTVINELTQRLENESKVEEIELDLQNSWVNYGGSFATAKAFKMKDIVFLRGLVKSGSANSVIATLPQGWRPSATVVCAAAKDSNQTCRIDVRTNGGIYLNVNNPAAWVSLSGIQFSKGTTQNTNTKIAEH